MTRTDCYARERRTKVLLHSLLAVVVLCLVLAACGGGERAAVTEEVSNRCSEASEDIVTAIADGLTLDGSSLRDARVVESNRFNGLIFVSAEITGTEAEGSDRIATWAFDQLLQIDPPEGWDRATIYSVNSPAAEFSDWADPRTQLTMESDGAEESHACAEAAD